MSIGNGSQLGKWFDDHGARLVLYARQWLDAAAAEDAVQEVFLHLAVEMPKPNSVRAWLFRAVRNAALSQHRSRQRRSAREQAVAAEREAWFVSSPEDRIDAATAREALESLPEAQREIVMLRIWGGLSLTECSQVMSEPVSTLSSRYKAALSAIRERMERSCPLNPINRMNPL